MSRSQVLVQRVGSIVGILAVVCILSGCTSPMALTRTSGPLHLETKSVAVLTLKTANQYKPAIQPVVESVELVSVDSGATQRFRIDPEAYNPPVGQASSSGSSNDLCDIVVALEVEPGNYTLKSVKGIGRPNSTGTAVALGILAGPGTALSGLGTFDFDVDYKFAVPKESVVYVGHVDMVNRERKGNEPRSGSIFPLVDQISSGFSGGTFDVKVSGRGEIDIPRIGQTYQCLRDARIGTAIMHK